MNNYYYYTPLFLQKIGRILFGILFKFFLRIEIIGNKKFLNHKGSIIFASNHSGEFDPVIFSLILPIFSPLYPLYFVSNPQERYKSFGWRSYFYGGKFFNWLGAYQIFSGRKNYAFALQNHINLLIKNKTVCIFPEGKRTSDGNFSQARGGLGYLMFSTFTPVLPVSIKTFYGVSFLDFILRRKKIKVYVGQMIYPKDVFTTKNPKVLDFQNASQKVLDIIKQNYDII
jgi:1-acyl-sn-glycerol-3-phosphate acyltransferase